MSKLWYNKPADCWEEALPIGNGRMGAMIFGTVETEHIQLNEDSVWYGGHIDRNNPDALKNLPQIRELILNGQIPEAEELTTAERLEKAKNGQVDKGMAKLYFDFGRYLLIASSREGTLPANLQGIWNKDMNPAWDSKYTININAQMNYWPAEVCNLSECHMPLMDLIKRGIPNYERGGIIFS